MSTQLLCWDAPDDLPSGNQAAYKQATINLTQVAVATAKSAMSRVMWIAGSTYFTVIHDCTQLSAGVVIRVVVHMTIYSYVTGGRFRKTLLHWLVIVSMHEHV